MALIFLKNKKTTMEDIAPNTMALMKELAKNKSPFWALETHGVSQGMLMEFLACKERARLGYVEGWTSTKSSDALIFGELFHSVLENLYKHLKIGGDINGPDYIKNVCTVELNEFKKRINKERLWIEEDERSFQMNSGYLHILVPEYVNQYWKKDRKQKWLIVEDEFQNSYAENIEISSSVKLKGRYDQVYENVHGEVWIKEMKTKSRIDPAIQDRLSFDFQAMFYIFNYWLEFKVMPAGFVYDLIQRPALRQGKAENLQHFMQRVKSDVDATYFKRIRMRVTLEELEQWIKKDFNPILRDFLTWAKGQSPAYRNPASCETRYGACKYLRVCGLKDFSGLYQKQHNLLTEKIV